MILSRPLKISGSPPRALPDFEIRFHPRRVPVLVRGRSLRAYLAENDMKPMRVFENGGVAEHADGHLVGFDLALLKPVTWG